MILIVIIIILSSFLILYSHENNLIPPIKVKFNSPLTLEQVQWNYYTRQRFKRTNQSNNN